MSARPDTPPGRESTSWIAADATVERIMLDDTSWVDVVRGLVVDSMDVHRDLAQQVAWQQGSNFRYERWVPEPRLSSYQSGDTRHPALAEVQQWISSRYHVRFDGVALAQYRDGRDSVGWHRDREMTWLDDTIIGVLTLGATRPFLVAPLDLEARTGRPARSASAGRGSRIARDHSADAPDAGTTLDLRPASGDLLVMGGRCQADWLHAVPPVPELVTVSSHAHSPSGATGVRGASRVSQVSRISAQWRWTSRTGRRDPNPSYFAPRYFGSGRGSGRTSRPR